MRAFRSTAQRWLIAILLVCVSGACDLNPQPLPPGGGTEAVGSGPGNAASSSGSAASGSASSSGSTASTSGESQGAASGTPPEEQPSGSSSGGASPVAAVDAGLSRESDAALGATDALSATDAQGSAEDASLDQGAADSSREDGEPDVSVEREGGESE